MAASASDSEASKLVPTDIEILPAGKLCPGDCGQHCRWLFCSFTLLIVLGSSLVQVLPVLAATVLSLGPTVIIITHFYRRYERSTSISQVAYTFSEAILWMVPLVMFIGYVDTFNTRMTGLPVELVCSWHPDDGGRAVVQALSFSAHCKSDLFESSLVGHWDGQKCSPALVNVSLPSLGNVSIPSPLRHDGSVPKRLLAGILNVSAQGAEGEASCPSLETALDEALDSVSVLSIVQGDRIVDTRSRKKIAGAFDKLFARETVASLGMPGGCKCSKSVYMDAAVRYDYCSPNGQCHLDDTWQCGALSNTGECAPASQENVSITFRFIRSTVLNSFTTAYLRAALLEESLKYVTVRRILFKDRVADCSGLLLYALAAAAGFATAENVQYTVANGIFVTYARMVLSVPFHCCTGLIIGIHLGYRKFLGWGYACPVTLLVPVLLHGTYDFVLMLPDDQGPSKAVRGVAVLAIMVGGFLYCRYAWLRLENVCVVDVKALQAEGRVSKSQCCCCERDCCRPLCEFEDPMLKGATGPSLSEAAVQTGDVYSNNFSNNAWRRSHSSLSDLGVSATKELWPEQPTCQTTLAECPQCGNDVRLHIFYPCTCPFCSHAFQSPVAQPPAPPPVVMPPKEEPTEGIPRAGLANRVIVLGFTSLLLHLATSVVLAATAYPEVDKLPHSHLKFQLDCAAGRLRHSFCRTVKHEFERRCKEENMHMSECKEQWYTNLGALKEDVALCMEIDIWFGFCCVMSISLCGCIGACRDSRPWVNCFWVMSILDVLWHGLQLLCGDLFCLLTVAFPVFGWYYGHQLRQAQAADSLDLPAQPGQP